MLMIILEHLEACLDSGVPWCFVTEGSQGRSIWEECGNRELMRRVLGAAHRIWLFAPKGPYSKIKCPGPKEKLGRIRNLVRRCGILRSNRHLVLRRKEERGRKTHLPLSGVHS